MKYTYSVLVLLAFSVIAVPVVRAEGPATTQTINQNSDITQANPAVVVSSVTSKSCTADVKNASMRGMWVWDSSIATDLANGSTAKADELFAFASSHNINAIYFSSYDLLAANDKWSWTVLSGFINAAKTHCLSVELLGGKPNWYQRKNVLEAMNFATLAVAFTNSLSDSDTKPTAVHLDVEPYIADDGEDWNASITSRTNVSVQFANMLSAMRLTLADSGLALSVDMPFWYSTTAGTTNITRFGKNKSLAQLIIDIADTVVIMDYRDTAFGTQSAKGVVNTTKDDSGNGMYDLVKTEMDYAARNRKKVVIAAETKCFADQSLSILSFCGTRTIGSDKDKTLLNIIKGNTYMETELKKVSDAFTGNTAFSGFAFHDYGAYKTLNP